MTNKENAEEVKIRHIIEYTKEELIKSIRTTKEINEKYATFDENTESWILKKDLNKFPSFCMDEKDLKGELWRHYLNEPNIKVSNLGRIKIDDKIVELVDEHVCEGYLYIKDHPIKKKVYRMVAETWLVKDMEGQKDFLEPWAVHHISNDGYDNSVQNLIWLKKQLHDEIHNEAKKRELSGECLD